MHDIRSLVRLYEDAGQYPPPPPPHQCREAQLNEMYNWWISPNLRQDILLLFVAQPDVDLLAIPACSSAAGSTGGSPQAAVPQKKVLYSSAGQKAIPLIEAARFITMFSHQWRRVPLYFTI